MGERSSPRDDKSLLISCTSLLSACCPALRDSMAWSSLLKSSLVGCVRPIWEAKSTRITRPAPRRTQLLRMLHLSLQIHSMTSVCLRTSLRQGTAIKRLAATASAPSLALAHEFVYTSRVAQPHINIAVRVDPAAMPGAAAVKAGQHRPVSV